MTSDKPMLPLYHAFFGVVINQGRLLEGRIMLTADYNLFIVGDTFDIFLIVKFIIYH